MEGQSRTRLGKGSVPYAEQTIQDLQFLKFGRLIAPLFLEHYQKEEKEKKEKKKVMSDHLLNSRREEIIRGIKLNVQTI